MKVMFQDRTNLYAQLNVEITQKGVSFHIPLMSDGPGIGTMEPICNLQKDQIKLLTEFLNLLVKEE